MHRNRGVPRPRVDCALVACVCWVAHLPRPRVPTGQAVRGFGLTCIGSGLACFYAGFGLYSRLLPSWIEVFFLIEAYYIIGVRWWTRLVQRNLYFRFKYAFSFKWKTLNLLAGMFFIGEKRRIWSFLRGGFNIIRIVLLFQEYFDLDFVFWSITLYNFLWYKLEIGMCNVHEKEYERLLSKPIIYGGCVLNHILFWWKGCPRGVKDGCIPPPSNYGSHFFAKIILFFPFYSVKHIYVWKLKDTGQRLKIICITIIKIITFIIFNNVNYMVTIVPHQTHLIFYGRNETCLMYDINIFLIYCCHLDCHGP